MCVSQKENKDDNDDTSSDSNDHRNFNGTELLFIPPFKETVRCYKILKIYDVKLNVRDKIGIFMMF